MPKRAYWQFYKTIFPFIAAISLMGMVFLGPLWGFLIFATLGLAFGFVGFQVFYSNQSYFYFNLGITKKKLVAVSFLINVLIGIPVFSVLILLIKIIFGNFQIT